MKPAAWLGAILCSTAPCIAGAMSPGEDVIYTMRGHNTWEDSLVRLSLNADADWILKEPFGTPSLIRAADGRQSSARLLEDLKEVEHPVWCGKKLLRVGTRQGKRGWYLEGESAPVAPDLPLTARAVCDREGQRFAFFKRFADAPGEPAPHGISIGDRHTLKTVDLSSHVTDAAFTADGQRLYVLARLSNGRSTLYAIPVDSPVPEVLATDLDAVTFPTSVLATGDDGADIFLVLAGDAAPDDAHRQIPREDSRWTKLYRFDVATRKLELLRSVVGADLMSPHVAAGHLYWVEQRSVRNVAVMPARGGPLVDLTSDGESEQPSWSRDGRQLAYLTGQYRLADYTLNWDIDAVALGANARPAGDARHFIQGNHEDFTPDWSPDGRWIAWHSHRAARLPAYYDDESSTDDIWLRLADDVRAPEIRLTSGGEETGWAHWAPNGRDILYTTWRADAPGIGILRMVSIDPQTGTPHDQRNVDLPKAVRSVTGCAWSPSGEQIALEDETSDSEKTLWIINADGSNLRRIARFRSETFGGLDWAPDGKTINFSALANNRMTIFAVDASGGVVRQLTHTDESLLQPRVSPDGRWIALWRARTALAVKRAPLPPRTKH